MWYFSTGEQQHGPVPLEELVGMLRGGSLKDYSLVWREGMAEWQAAGEIVEVQQALAQSRVVPGMMVPPGAMVAPQNGLALTSMVLGIVSIVLGLFMFIGIVTAIPGVICGHIARRQIRESPLPQVGSGMAIAGLIMGYLCIILTVIMVLAVAGMFFFAYKKSGGMP
jgi:hypothetical protein